MKPLPVRVWHGQPRPKPQGICAHGMSCDCPPCSCQSKSRLRRVHRSQEAFLLVGHWFVRPLSYLSKNGPSFCRRAGRQAQGSSTRIIRQGKQEKAYACGEEAEQAPRAPDPGRARADRARPVAALSCTGRCRMSTSSALPCSGRRATSTTGHVYDVEIGKQAACTCPDHASGKLCTHILFVFLRVLRVARTNSQTSFGRQRC